MVVMVMMMAMVVIVVGMVMGLATRTVAMLGMEDWGAST